MYTPDELREQSRRFREAATLETNRDFRPWLVSHAYALAQRAEEIERERACEPGGHGAAPSGTDIPGTTAA